MDRTEKVLTPAQQAQVEKIASAIVKILYLEMEPIRPTHAKEWADAVANEILSLKGLAILDEDQTLPPQLYAYKDGIAEAFTEEAVKQDMLKASFKRVIKVA